MGYRTEEPTTTSHYQRLGVTPAASTEEIRAAYRTLAGRLHPDRQVGATEAERGLAERRMREVNASWHVLGDPVRRRAYDEQRRGVDRRASSSGASPPRDRGPGLVRSDDDVDDDLVDVLPPMTAMTAGLFRHLPWVVLLVVLGLIFVITAYAGDDDPPTSSRPADAAVGDCLDVAPGPSITVVPCTGPHEYQVVQRVSSATACPAGTEPRRFASDLMFDCLERGTSPSTPPG